MATREATVERMSTLAAVVSLFLLVLNDRFLKQNPNWLTGKLSDAAGLFLIPYPLVGMYLFVRREKASLARAFHPIFYTAVVGAAFVLAKTLPAGADFLERVWPWPAQWGPVQIVCDPTDVVTLPFLWLGYRAAWKFWPPSEALRR